MGRSAKRAKKPARPSPSGTAWQGWLAGAVLFLGAFLLYLPTRDFVYVNYDDVEYVIDNPNMPAGLTWENVRWAFTTFYACNWHPLTWLSHLLDRTLFGPAPGPAHLVNVGFHAANTVLLFVLLSRLTKARWKSALAAAIFAWHPSHVESVAWIAERKDVLSAFWGLLSLWFYARWAGSNSRKPRDFILSLVCFALGLLAKPMLVTWPFLMLVLDVWPLRRSPHWLNPAMLGLAREKIPFFLLSALSCFATLVAQKTGGAVIPLEVLGMDARIGNAAVSYARYAGQFLWPGGLMIPYLRIWNLSPWTGGAIMMTLVLATILLLRGSPQRHCLAAGWLWFLGTLVPVIGLLQVGGQAMADRYTYIPFIGLSVMLIWGLASLPLPTRGTAPLMVSLSAGYLAILGLLTHWQMQHWKNGEVLFQHTLSLDPGNIQAANGLAWTYATDLDPAIRNGAKAVRLAEALVRHTQRSEPELLNTLAAAYAETANFPLAVQTAEESLAFPRVQKQQMFLYHARTELAKYRQGRALRP